MLAHVKVTYSLQRRRQKPESRGTKLCSFKAPSGNVDGNYLKDIYERPPVKVNGYYSIQAGWHGRVHKPYVYYEPVATMLQTIIYPLFYYCNNIHASIPEFTNWWTSQCSPPQHSLQNNGLIYVANVDKYIKVLDVIPQNKCWIYPGYENCTIGSGKEIVIGGPNAGTIIDSKIIYIGDQYDIIDFESIAEAKRHFEEANTYKSYFLGHVKEGTIGKLKKGMKTKPVIYRSNWFGWKRVWIFYLKPFLESQHFHFSENASEIQLPIRNECMLRSFVLDRGEYELESRRCWLFNDYIVIKIDKKKKKK
eukprot:546646_1